MNLTILDTVLNNFESIFISGAGNLSGMAMGLLFKLIVIDLVLAILLNLEDGNHIQTMISKTLKYGIWIAIVTHYGEGVNILIQGFKEVGLTAGGGLIDESVMKHPSEIMQASFKITNPLTDWMAQFKNLIDICANAMPIGLTFISVLLVKLSFIIIAINVFITYLEFYIVATLALIFMPFGANKYTKNYAEKAMGAVVAFGVKFMVLSFILSASIPQINKFVVTIDKVPTDETLTACVSVCACLAILSWHAPNMASGLMAGSPSMTASNVKSAVSSATNSARSAASGVVSGGKSALNAIKTAAGKL